MWREKKPFHISHQTVRINVKNGANYIDEQCQLTDTHIDFGGCWGNEERS